MGEESLEIVKKRLRARFQGGSTQTARDVMKLIQELEEALSDRAGMRDERESAIRECLSLQERHEAHNGAPRPFIRIRRLMRSCKP